MIALTATAIPTVQRNVVAVAVPRAKDFLTLSFLAVSCFVPTMSTNDFDYLEFAHCGACMAEYLPLGEGAPPQPFWLTDCGHILCNQHLSLSFAYILHATLSYMQRSGRRG